MYTVNNKWEPTLWYREILDALWLPKWEGNPKKKRGYMYSWFTLLLSQHRKNSYASIKVNNKRKKHEERSSDEREWERERMLGYERVSLKEVLSRVMIGISLWRKCLRPRKEPFKKILVQCLVLTRDKQLYSIPSDRLDYSSLMGHWEEHSENPCYSIGNKQL